MLVTGVHIRKHKSRLEMRDTYVCLAFLNDTVPGKEGCWWVKYLSLKKRKVKNISLKYMSL